VFVAPGINLSNVSQRRTKHLEREAMILRIRQRQAAVRSLVWTKVCLENRDHTRAIRREFRNSRKVI